MITSNRVKERIGVNLVATIVEGAWESGWQEYDASNDDAIDGVILLRKGRKQPTDTGGIVFTQVKCGGHGYRKDQAQYPNYVGIALGKAYIDAHRARWQRVPGPAVLIFVDDQLESTNPPAWWVDLKNPNSYSPTNSGMILIPKQQKFTRHSKGDFHKLCGAAAYDRQLEKFILTRSENLIPRLGKNESLRNDAWNFYKSWRKDPAACTHKVLGLILVNRVGWKHMSRPGRLSERIVQSWTLLGAAKLIVSNSTTFFHLGHARTARLPDGNLHAVDYLGLRSMVIFTHRHHAVVQVVLKRSRLLCPGNLYEERQKIWFYSVYELRRGTAVV
jgi:hypothetical protein